MSSPICYQLALAYVNICCVTLSEKDFQKILSDDVQLIHQTNDEPPFQARGIESVTSLFKKYIFNNTSNVDIRSVRLKSVDDTIVLDLIVAEDKKDQQGKITRYIFEESTTFKFYQEARKISFISSSVKRKNFSRSKL